MRLNGKRSACAAICVACALISVFVFGGLKLKGKYNAVKDVFMDGTDTTLSTRHSMDAYLDRCAEHAIKLAEEAKQYISDDELISGVIDDANELLAMDGISGRYKVYASLSGRVESLYSALQAAGKAEEKAVKLEYGDFTSAQDMIKRDGYYDYAKAYNSDRNAFPANMIGSIWGAESADTFSK